jgi:hypothetical protein
LVIYKLGAKQWIFEAKGKERKKEKGIKGGIRYWELKVSVSV